MTIKAKLCRCEGQLRLKASLLVTLLPGLLKLNILHFCPLTIHFCLYCFNEHLFILFSFNIQPRWIKPTSPGWFNFVLLFFFFFFKSFPLSFCLYAGSSTLKPRAGIEELPVFHSPNLSSQDNVGLHWSFILT